MTSTVIDIAWHIKLYRLLRRTKVLLNILEAHPAMEKESLLLPTEDKNAVPSRIFKNKLTWLLHDWSRFTPAYVSLLVAHAIWAIPVYYMSPWSGNPGYIILSLTIWFLLLEVAFAVVAILALRNRKLVFLKAYEDVANHISAQRPGTDLNMWDSIALELNSTFAKDESWHSSVCLWDCADCYACFRSLLYIPFKHEKLDGDVRAVIGDSILVYEDSVEQRWTYKMDIEKLCETASLNKLPQELYSSKFTWTMTNLMKRKSNWLCALCFIHLSSLWWTVGYFVGFVLASVLETTIAARTRLLDIQNSFRLLVIVANQESSEDEADWDQIAKAVNELVQESPLSSFFKAGFFFDGDDCHRVFENRVETILCGKESSYPELVPLASRCQAISGLDAGEKV
ncbi:LADA_0G16820g1_1 [Lachancea dasiensis]|uniref:LADA_0G16820g1_1 n=1 Tax=Lachancea dasiensis TaxID=1072105 RepID=A0A1G4JX60_9SACH|nr:LADA_0G16820g1_1 [Lachancea dasiensis]